MCGKKISGGFTINTVTSEPPHTASFRDLRLGAPPMEAMVGPRAMLGAQVAEFARVFDLAGTPD